MKLHSKPPANHLQTAFRVAHPALFSLLFTLFSLHSPASVPLAWHVTPRNPAPVAFDRHHGETLELRCTFTGFGELPFAQGADIRLWYQTNGMAAAWWSVPASVSSNVLSATFPPSADPGADRLSLFFGAPSNAYASAVLRLRHSPGFTPNIIPPPDVTNWVEDLAAVRAIIDYSTSNADLVATIKATAPAPSDYETVSNRAMSAVQMETDPTVPAWAKAETPPASGLTTNDVFNIVTNDVVVEYGNWVCEPSEFDGVPIWLDGDGEDEDGRYWMIVWFGSQYEIGNKDSTYLTFNLYDTNGRTNFTVTATRQCFTRNALGLARLVDLPPLTNAIPDAAARAVYDVHDLMWDETESILYWHKIRQGHDEYIAVTNIDLTHPTNAVILKAWREANQ